MIVCDGSWAIALLFPDEEKPEHAQDVLGCELVAPMVWRIEIAQALRTATLRKRFTKPVAKQLAQSFDAFEITLVDTPFSNVSAAHEFAQFHSLSGYDASYLAYAIQHQFALATRDAALCDAAMRAGITVYQ
jgi:predicted nucleic acid-binding protein